VRGLASAALLAAVTLSGCGADSVENAPSLAEIAAVTRADPYRFEISMETEGVEEAFTATASGAVDHGKKLGVIRYRFAGPDEIEFRMEVRRIGGETYRCFSPTGSVADGWGRQATVEADALGPFGAFSEPHGAADALASHGRDVHAGPGEPVDGIPTTHYRATVPTIEIFGANATPARRAELEKEIRVTESESARVEAWAGVDGLLRRLEIEIPLAEVDDAGHFRMSTTFSDFGKPIEVEVPTASELSDGVEGTSELCREEESAPYSAESVVAALRKAGFSAHGSCDGEETLIYAFPLEEDEDDDNDAVICVVTHRPTPSPGLDDVVVRGNVACAVEVRRRAAVRTILAGL
jgi:hypothetical protein